MVVDPMFVIGALVCLVSSILCIGAAVLRQGPNDITILADAAVLLYLIVYGIGAGIRIAGGEALAGPAWEFWGYYATAMLIPVGAFWWAIMDRSRWSNLVLGAVGVTVFVMIFRMEQIWDGVQAA